MSAGDWLLVVAILLYAGAAAAYCLDRQWGKVVYFAGAVVLTVGVLMIKG